MKSNHNDLFSCVAKSAVLVLKLQKDRTALNQEKLVEMLLLHLKSIRVPSE